MSESELLQRKLNLMRGEPVVPLTLALAIKHAHQLRLRGLTYRSIAVVMGLYHGQFYSEATWRWHCRQMGVPARAYRKGRAAS